jgi:hypothetical protein
MLPKALQDRPLLKPSNKPYLTAFYELSGGRSIGEVVQPISTSDLFTYMDGFGILDPEERGRFFTRVRALDSAYVKHMLAKAEAAAKQK